MILLEASDEGIPDKGIWLGHLIEQLGCIWHDSKRSAIGYEVADGETAVVKAGAEEVYMERL